MDKQQDILVSTSVLVKAPGDDKRMRELRDRIASRVQQALERALSSESIEWTQQLTNFHYLDSSVAGAENARRCVYCSAWATDRTKLRAIDGLIPGCDLDGRWVCDQCIERHEQTTSRA